MLAPLGRSDVRNSLSLTNNTRLGLVSDSMHLVEAVSQRLDSFVTEQRESAAPYGPVAGQLIDAAAVTLSGGKRLRARFCHTGWLAAGATPLSPEIIGVAASLEIFQAAALVHDDIIDHSDTRRGRASAHRALEASHLELGWSGDAQDFGVSGAILLGDLLVAWSDDLFEQSVDAHPNAAIARTEYARMRRDVTIGQFLDVAQESAWTTQHDSLHAGAALDIASLKSARYSVEQPLIIGAALAGGSAEQRTALRAFGHNIGIAFQMRDDVLGVFGDESQTGKPAGDDIREGKRTLLVAYTREHLDLTSQVTFDELLGDPELSVDQIQSMRATMTATGALARVEKLIAERSAAALAELEGAPIEESAKDALRRLVDAAVNRSA